MKRFIRWLLGLFGFRGTPPDSPVPPMTDDAPPETTVPPPKTIVPLLIFPLTRRPTHPQRDHPGR